MEKSNPDKLNFFTAAFISILGISLIGEIIMENDLPDKIDDTLMAILAVVAIVWYRTNALKKSLMPIVLVLVGIAIKIMAITVEIDDKEAVGDDFGILTALIIALVVVYLQYRKLKSK